MTKIKKNQRILILGSGGREDALSWKLQQSPYVSHIYIAPGNGGTDRFPNVENIALDINSPREVVKACKELSITFVVVGSDEPLQYGVVDKLTNTKIPSYGPTKKAALIEGSKVFSTRFMKRNGIPHPQSFVFSAFSKAAAFLKSNKPWFKEGIVIKADGLALGKGAVVCSSVSKALNVAKDMMINKQFGASGKRIVMQRKLKGFEVSVTVVSDGTNYVILPFTEDHKQAYNGDKGPNTGGMGVSCPHPLVTPALIKKIENEIVKPTLNAMKKEGREFKGTLYPGLMVVENNPYVIEYNGRFGDPEIEALVPILPQSLDLFKLFYNASSGNFSKSYIIRSRRVSVVVTLASGGYPVKYKKGVFIYGLDKKSGKDMVVFHAGTKKTHKGYETAGGRVLMLTGVSTTLAGARKKAYKKVGKNGVHFTNMHFRTDIGNRKRSYGSPN